jgi:hypothetical protein
MHSEAGSMNTASTASMRLLRFFVLFALATASLLSLAVGIHQALHGSIDFQWSGAHIFAQHRDAYAVFLHGDPKHELLLSQIPNYLHEYYIMILPLGMLSFSTALRIWCVFNVLAAFTAIFLVRYILRLNNTQTMWTALLFLSCTPLRVVLANGQASMFYLLLILAAIAVQSSIAKGLWLGLSWFKYSFGPVFFMTWLFQRRWVVLTLSMVAPLIGLAALFELVHTPGLLLEPLKSANISVSPGYGDLMTFTKVLAHVQAGHASSRLRVILPYIVSLGGTIACALWLAAKKLDEALQCAILFALTLLLFPHLDYDFVVLLYPLAFVLRSTDLPRKIPCVAAICALWFGPTLVSRLHLKDTLTALVANALLLILLTYSLTRLGKANEITESAQAS